MKKQIIIDVVNTGFIITLKCGNYEEVHVTANKRYLSKIINTLAEKKIPESDPKPIKNKML